MKAINEIKDELDKNIIKRRGIAVKSYRRKEWYNGYIKGLEMAIYLINKETNSSSSEKPIYLSACENKFNLNTKNSKEAKKQ